MMVYYRQNLILIANPLPYFEGHHYFLQQKRNLRSLILIIFDHSKKKSI
jgi:hypothetical protein